MDESDEDALQAVSPENLPGVLKRLPPDEISRLVSIGVLTVSKQHNGPLPPAEEFALYEQTHQGTAERILAYMEREQTFRHELARKEQRALNWETIRGQVFGFIVMAGSLAAGVYSFVIGAHPAVTIAFVSVPVISAVKAFIEGRAKQDD
ncbi:putative inner membrane protein [Methylocella silvestris BL2]|uniref:Putative inner membrane protein n=1 Tax=Methylocella silvestris (strain DSM 15510 / CIP 108128 / LMG 27833 / NCIMB 13906 / BL2) TaxID=395965 RepID=B8ENR5_METSB|nr:DUF2335 domain-containing protein [Methylocella silvestris]ACK50851.1 putative inner membrane protein [Methylocella silvestris BL2]